MRAEIRRSRVSQTSLGYALVTLLGSAIVVGLVGGTPERIGGAVLAWAIQSHAFWRLSEALYARRDARGVWLGGMAARGLGFLTCGGCAIAGLAGNDLPVAYGISMLVLLLTEALWLARTSPSGGGVSVGAANELDGTHSIG